MTTSAALLGLIPILAINLTALILAIRITLHPSSHQLEEN